MIYEQIWWRCGDRNLLTGIFCEHNKSNRTLILITLYAFTIETHAVLLHLCRDTVKAIYEDRKLHPFLMPVSDVSFFPSDD